MTQSALIFIVLSLFFSCAGSPSYLNTKNEELAELLDHYKKEATASNSAFILIKKILPFFAENEQDPRFVLLLSDHIQLFPDDPYNTYYLFRIAEHLRPHTPREALPYLRRIINSNSYLNIDGISIRKSTLEILAALDPDPRMRIHYLEALIQQYPIRDENVSRYLDLANVYASLGKWEHTYDAYLAYRDTANVFEENSSTYKNISQWINIYNSPRNWTREHLDDLVANIKIAIANRNISSLLRYRARSNFFTMSWNQEEFDENSQLSSSFNIGAFLLRSRVHYATDLEIESNNKEAYLRTWGWSYRIPVWYFYFRRVNFPADPEIHGNWEWAGIFFGDSL